MRQSKRSTRTSNKKQKLKQTYHTKQDHEKKPAQKKIQIEQSGQDITWDAGILAELLILASS